MRKNLPPQPTKLPNYTSDKTLILKLVKKITIKREKKESHLEKIKLYDPNNEKKEERKKINSRVEEERERGKM